MQPPFMRSMLAGMPGETITDEMRSKALLQAKDSLQKLDGIRKELGIPADQLYLVIDMYSGHLQTLVSADYQERQKVKNKARKAKFAEAMKANPQYGYGIGQYAQVGQLGQPLPGLPSGLGYDPMFDDDDEE